MKKIILFIGLFALIHFSVVGQTTFSSKITIDANTGANPYYLDSGLANNDTYPDIVVSAYYGNRINYYENNGDGSFASALVVSNTFSQAAVEFADIDGINGPDIIACSYNGGQVSWFSNDGTGSFGPQTDIDTGLAGPSDLHAFDLNGDTFLDIVVSDNSGNTVVWYQNDGSGNFLAVQTVTTAISLPGDFDAIDFDGDGDLDLVIMSTEFQSTGNIEVFYNNLIPSGTVSFTQDSNSVSNSGNGYLFDVDFADVDNDGMVDIAVADPYGDFAWYKKEGDGTYTETIISSATTNPGSIAIADMDNDGLNDVVVTNSSTTGSVDVAWFKSSDTPPTTLGSEMTIDGTQQQVFGLELADYDQDGDIDIVTISYFENDLNIIYNELETLGSPKFSNMIQGIYPNPTNKDLRFKGFESQNLEISIYDVLGKQVLNKSVPSQQSLNVSNLKKGVYILKINNHDVIYKFVKQ